MCWEDLCIVAGILLMGVGVVGGLGGQKWGSKNREKWSSGMGVLQN